MKTRLFWALTAGAVLGVALCWTWLSAAFVYGQAHAERPIPAFLLVYLAGFGALAAGFLLARRSGPPSLVFVLAVAACARLLLAPSGLIQENDVYRYVLDGQTVLAGENPYRNAPLMVEELAPEAVRQRLGSDAATEVLRRIGHAHVPTIYPPGAQFVFAAGAGAGGWDWKAQRFVFLAVETLAIGVLLLLFRRTETAPGWIFLYAWNPLVLKEIANSAHLDVLVLFWLATALLLLSRRPALPTIALAGSGAAMGMAVLSKLYPVVLLPALTAFAFRRCGLRALALPAAAGGIIALGYAPFADVSVATLTAGLHTYTAEWNANQGAFAVLQSLVSSRPGALALGGLLAAGTPLLLRAETTAGLIRQVWMTLLLWFLFVPAPFPWYAVPLIGLACLHASSSGGWVILLLSGPLGLYYLRFLYEYRAFPEVWLTTTLVVEHGLIWIGLLTLVLFRLRGAAGAWQPFNNVPMEKLRS